MPVVEGKLLLMDTLITKPYSIRTANKPNKQTRSHIKNSMMNDVEFQFNSMQIQEAEKMIKFRDKINRKVLQCKY